VLWIVQKRHICLEVVLLSLSQNVKKKAYGSTEAFVADVKWIVHNCIVYNGSMLFHLIVHSQNLSLGGQ